MKSSRLLLVVAVVLALVAASCSSGASNANTATPIHHVVVIFQENVSFDHYFGTYPRAANIDGQPFAALPGAAKGTYLIEEVSVTAVPVPRLVAPPP